MTIKDVLQLFKMINIYFPNKIKGTDEEILEIANYWLDMLKDYDPILVANNFKKHIRDKTFAPTIADLVKEDPNYSSVPGVEETKLLIAQKEAEMPDVQVDRELISEMIRKNREEIAREKADELKRNFIESFKQ